MNRNIWIFKGIRLIRNGQKTYEPVGVLKVGDLKKELVAERQMGQRNVELNRILYGI